MQKLSDFQSVLSDAEGRRLHAIEIVKFYVKPITVTASRWARTSEFNPSSSPAFLEDIDDDIAANMIDLFDILQRHRNDILTITNINE